MKTKKTTDYAKERKNALTGIIVSAVFSVLSVVLILAGAALLLEARAIEFESRSRVEEFDPQATWNRNNSWKTMELQALSYDFAEDFKGTYHYYFGFTEYGDVRIIKMKGELAPEFTPYVDYLFSEENVELPELLEIRGTAIEMEEDIREYAIDALNEMFGEEVVTEDTADEILGKSCLDLTAAPKGYGDRDGAYLCLAIGGSMLVCSIIFIIYNVRKRREMGLALEKEKQSFAAANAYQNPAVETENAAGEIDIVKIYDTMYQQPAPVNPLEEMAKENPAEVTSGNALLGILGAIGGSLIGVVLWLLIGFAGFIAGIAGFVMLKFALAGYRKLSGKLGRKGAIFCLVLTIVMIFVANVLECGLVICRAFFEYEASMDTVRYVAMNFMELMDTGEMWPDFFKNLLVGYGLSIWSSYSLIGSILHYREVK